MIIGHLESLHAFYGDELGVRIARKHLGWYGRQLDGAPGLPRRLLTATHAAEQLELARAFLDGAVTGIDRAA